VTPIIKNARVATLELSRQLAPQRGPRPAARRSPEDSLELQSDALSGDLPASGYAPAAVRAAGARAFAASQGTEGSPDTDLIEDGGARQQSVADELLADDPAYRAAYEDGCQEGIKQGHADGHAQGLEQGRQEGRAQAEQEMDQQQQAEASRALDAAEAGVSALQALLTQLQEADSTLQAKAEVLAVDIAWTALMRLLAEAAGKRETVAAMVRAVLGQSRSQQVLRIGLSQADLALMQKELPTDFAGFSLVADVRVQSGGCIVETVAGALDGRLETQLHALRQVLVAPEESATGAA
jgi:flagellar assembly protein FliH